MGRLFDAVASLAGIRHKINYVAQAAIELESLCDPDEYHVYPYAISNDVIRIQPILQAVVHDVQANINAGKIAARFHNTIAALSLEIIIKLHEQTGVNTVALSGGVWQNTALLSKLLRLMEGLKFSVILHKELPSNDGGISFGQAIAAPHEPHDTRRDVLVRALRSIAIKRADMLSVAARSFDRRRSTGTGTPAPFCQPRSQRGHSVSAI